MSQRAARATLPPMPNRLVRRWYARMLEFIPEADRAFEEEGSSCRERAHRAWRIRMYARQTARSMMRDPREVDALRSRDAAVYGHPDGPTFEGARDRALRRLQSGSGVFVTDRAVDEELIRSASRSNPHARALFEG